MGVRGWDQQDVSAAARLPDDNSETSVRRQFEIRTIGDADGQAVYDALLYQVDAGAIFRAGTTELVGSLSQGGVMLEQPDGALRVALQTCVAGKPPKKTPTKRKKS